MLQPHAFLLCYQACLRQCVLELGNNHIVWHFDVIHLHIDLILVFVIVVWNTKMSFVGRNGIGTFGSGPQQLAPTCYIQSVITGECSSRPVNAEPALRGVIEMYNGPMLVPGAVCGSNTLNSNLPCAGGYCSDLYNGRCVRTDATIDPRVNLKYTTYGTRHL